MVNEQDYKSMKFFLVSERCDMAKNIHSKKCWVVLTQFWVKYGQTQPLGKKCHLKM